MNPLVADVSVARGPDPMPVVVQALAHQRFLGRRAAPQVIIDPWRNGLRPRYLADAVAALVADPAGHQDFAQVAGPQPLDGLRHAFARRAALRAGLHDALVAPRGVHRLAAFPNVVGNRFFHVHVFARLAAPDDDQRMPVIRRGGRDRVHVLAVEQLADVRVRLHALTLALQPRRGTFQRTCIAVAQGGHPHTGNRAEPFDVVAAATPHADHADADLVVARWHLAPRGGRQAACGSAQGGGLQKTASSEVIHCHDGGFLVMKQACGQTSQSKV